VAQAGNPNWVKGKSGNPTGRPTGSTGRFSVKALHEALAKVEAEKGESFLENVIRRAYTEDSVAIALLRKLLPDLKQIAATLERADGLYATMTPDEAARAMDADTLGEKPNEE